MSSLSPSRRGFPLPCYVPHSNPMATTSNKKMASPSPMPDMPDQLLAEIFLRLPTPQDLARASAVCTTFRRISTDRSFLRCFRCLHAPPLLGFLDRDGFHPALPSTPAVRAVAAAADFTFSFLPHHRRWTVQDVRDGRVLLSRSTGKLGQPPVFRDLAVCDPLHRRYVLLPPLPHDLAALLGHPFPPVTEACCKRFLVPLGEEEAAAGDTTFRVILLDTTNMEFSAADLPPGEWSKEGIAIVEAGEGRLGIFGFRGELASSLSYTTARTKGESPSQWQMEKTISLDSGYKYCIRDATQRYLLLTRIEASSLNNHLVGYFSMDIKTLQLQRVYEKQHYSNQTYTYINFPPSLLSSRRI
ncbi:unnamed protein product [Triticum turgidum subsp. durum]|uniref:F-box domain-containing protein n=1 Tax=Triticum turgidum subsp. durum TaxID=4567 RepID=A0A9R0Z815_TRITD|nr:unnamed protein product [Triticum turgidum subsp. durum]